MVVHGGEGRALNRVVEKEGNPPSATTWMDLEGITPSERSQRRPKTTWSHLDVESKRTELRGREWSGGRWGPGKMEMLVEGATLQL